MFARSWWKRKGKEAADAPAPALSLALQGGGAHGAYTWGVLDRLLEDDWRLDGISGTSAGAMNAVALADGWVRGGAEGARESLAGFWEAVADSTPFELDLLHSLNGLGGSADGGLVQQGLAAAALHPGRLHIAVGVEEQQQQHLALQAPGNGLGRIQGLPRQLAEGAAGGVPRQDRVAVETGRRLLETGRCRFGRGLFHRRFLRRSRLGRCRFGGWLGRRFRCRKGRSFNNFFALFAGGLVVLRHRQDSPVSNGGRGLKQQGNNIRKLLHALEATQIENALPLGTLPNSPETGVGTAQPTTVRRTVSLPQLLQNATRNDGKPYDL